HLRPGERLADLRQQRQRPRRRDALRHAGGRPDAHQHRFSCHRVRPPNPASRSRKPTSIAEDDFLAEISTNQVNTNGGAGYTYSQVEQQVTVDYGVLIYSSQADGIDDKFIPGRTLVNHGYILSTDVMDGVGVAFHGGSDIIINASDGTI